MNLGTYDFYNYCRCVEKNEISEGNERIYVLI